MEKPEETAWYRAVIDTRELSYLDLPGYLNAPIGALFNTNPPAQQVDANTGAPINPVTPRPTSDNELRAQSRPDYQPNDKIAVWLGFSQHLEQHSSLIIRVTVPDEAVPAGIDSDLVGKGLVLKIKMYAENLSDTTEACLRKLIADETGDPIMPLSNLPFIVSKTPKFTETVNSIYKLRLIFKNHTRVVTSENIFTDLMFPFHEPTNRALQILRKIFEQDATSFDIYIKDEERNRVSDVSTSTFERLRNELANPGTFQRFYTQNFQNNTEAHDINTGNLKPKESRPKVTTYPQSSFRNIFEFTTGLGVAKIEALEDMNARVMALNSTPANIRIIEALGAGDAMYFGVFSGIHKNIRLTPGDKFKVNFRLVDNVPDEDWDFTVCEPFKWSIQGEVVGVLVRPREPIPQGADAAARRAFRPYQKTKLPISRCRAKTMEDARSILEEATVIRCLITYSSSDKSETRAVAAMNILCNGSRPIHREERVAGGPTRAESEVVRAWAQWLLMQDARVYDTLDFVGDGLGANYLSRLTDEDHAEVLQYLRKTPVGFTGNALAVIRGLAGAGKTTFMADLIVAHMLDNPDHRILVVTSSNSATDVIISKVNAAMESAKNQSTQYRQALQACTAVRLHHDAAETSFMLSHAEQQYEQSAARQRAEILFNIEVEDFQAECVRFSSSLFDRLPPLRAATPTQDESEVDETNTTGGVSISDAPIEGNPLSNPGSDPQTSTKNTTESISTRPLLSHSEYEAALGKSSTRHSFLYDHYGADILLCEFYEQATTGPTRPRANTFSSLGLPKVKDYQPLLVDFYLPEKLIADNGDINGDESDETESEDEGEDFGDTVRPKGKKAKRRTNNRKGKRRAAELADRRANYTEDDDNNAITLADEDLEGFDNNLEFFGPLLENNAINLNHASISDDMKTLVTAIDMVEAYNREVAPMHSGVKDRRFQQAELSIARQVMKTAEQDPTLRGFAQLYQRYCDEGATINDEDMVALKTNLKIALRAVKGSANVVAMTVNALGIASHQRGLGLSFDAVFIDEAGRLDLADTSMIAAAVDCTTWVVGGDPKQYGPQAPMVTGALGCTKDLSISLMDYLRRNFWPSATLFLQRRGAPNIGILSSPMFYNNQMRDAPCCFLPGAHPKTADILNFFIQLFPECTTPAPVRYIDLRGRNDLRDELTGSYYSPDEAAVIVNIVEKGILGGIFVAEDVPVITHYTAQQKVFRHAFAKLNLEFPNRGFDKVMDHTTATFQGNGATLPIGSPVRTNNPGFTSDRGQNCVLMTRGIDFSLTVANVNNLVNPHGRGTPPMKELLYMARRKRVAVVVKRGSDNEDLMTHRYVHAQVIGTDENVTQLEDQDFVFDPIDEENGDSTANNTGTGWGDQVDSSNSGWDTTENNPTSATTGSGWDTAENKSTSPPVTTSAEGESLENSTSPSVTTSAEVESLENSTSPHVTTSAEGESLENSTSPHVTTSAEGESLENSTSPPVTTSAEGESLENSSASNNSLNTSTGEPSGTNNGSDFGAVTSENDTSGEASGTSNDGKSGAVTFENDTSGEASGTSNDSTSGAVTSENDTSIKTSATKTDRFYEEVGESSRSGAARALRGPITSTLSDLAVNPNNVQQPNTSEKFNAAEAMKNIAKGGLGRGLRD
ncbi:hypothetical protein ONS96_004844 [Cadophora gregata f. sp. sojae]|nr:hypothetical protein ONS96_004844 [Cadophora gregata f. sp. sojae]